MMLLCVPPLAAQYPGMAGVLLLLRVLDIFMHLMRAACPAAW